MNVRVNFQNSISFLFISDTNLIEVLSERVYIIYIVPNIFGIVWVLVGPNPTKFSLKMELTKIIFLGIKCTCALSIILEALFLGYYTND